MKIFVGVDGGGTKTHVLAESEDGSVPFDAVFAGSAYSSLGPKALKALLEEIRDGVVRLVGSEHEFYWALGLPGYLDTPFLTVRVGRVADDVFSNHAHDVFNDVRLAHEGALGGAEGVVALSGTGSMALGRTNAGREFRTGGWGPLFGDEGSSYAIGIAALRSVSQMVDGRLPLSALQEAVMEAFSSRDLYGVAEILSKSKDRKRQTVAAIAAIVDRVALSGDVLAQSLLEQAARDLGRQVVAVTKHLGLSPCAPISYLGGTFNSTIVRQTFAQYLQDEELPNPQPPLATPSAGGILLARKLALKS